MGPLNGVRIVEFAGIGPGPFACMLLADMGAEIIKIDRANDKTGASPTEGLENWVGLRGRKSVILNLKSPEGVEAALKLVQQADILVEGYRPGVMEKLGLGPDVCLKRNPKLVFGRMTGWGQEGPMAHAAGHDINYIALAGALYHFNDHGGRPVPPLNLAGDFGGGSMYLVMGVLAAYIEAQKSGQGQVVDTAMVDGAASLMAMHWGFRGTKQPFDIEGQPRGWSLLEGGAPFYGSFETKDGGWVSLGAIEPQFYALMREKMGLTEDPDFDNQFDMKRWPELSDKIATLVKTKTRDEWCALMEGSDVCFAPVLSMSEAAEHPHMKARGSFIEVLGKVQPAPAPRFSRTPGEVQGPPPAAGKDTRAVLQAWGFSKDEVEALIEKGAAVSA